MQTHTPGAVHVVRGRSAGAVLARHGLRTEVVDDSLVYGPVSLDAVQHGRVRREFWRRERLLGPGLGTFKRTEGGRAHVAFPQLRDALMESGARRLVLWLSPLWPDVLFFWWFSHGLLTAGVPGAELFVAHPPRGRWPGAMNPPDVEAARTVGPLGARDIRVAARLWEYFASPSPGALDRARRVPRANAPLGALKYYASLLPQFGNPPALFPSVADSWLLSGFADAKPAHAVMSNPWGRQADRWLLNMGEEFIFTRLWRWSTHLNGRWLKRSPEPGRDLRYVRYVMTDECRELLRNGTYRESDLAPITVGGLQVPVAHWVRIRPASGTAWRISRRRFASSDQRRARK